MVLRCGAQERVGDRVRFVATLNGYNGPNEENLLGAYGTISHVSASFIRVIWDDAVDAGPGWGHFNTHLFKAESLALSTTPYTPPQIFPVDDTEVKTIWY